MINDLATCKICNEPVSALTHFYRKHDLKLEDYCLQYFDRRDLLDGSVIPFKSPEQYFSVQFLNKNNLKKYLKGLPKEKAAGFCKEMIIKRKAGKNLIYTPLQVELASLPCFPPVHYLSGLFDYYGFCKEIGLNKRVLPHNNFSFDSYKPENHHIVIDSRESQPIKFDIEYRIDKLNVGDYMFSGNPNLIFDRKSLPDFVGTMSQGLERFTKELERANNTGVYLVMIVENTLQEALTFNHLPWMKRVKTKATPDYIFHNLRELIQKFPRFQPLFVNGRTQVKEYMMKGFSSGDTFCNYDLQLLYQLKLI